jgi:hypothetical protein
MMKKFFRIDVGFPMTSCSDFIFSVSALWEAMYEASVFNKAFVDETSWNEVAEELVGHLRGGHDKTDWDRLVRQ